jgi:3-hydroxyisobutyrate dehydrogenase-like beta-hydroxyacid dehydrogenase
MNRIGIIGVGLMGHGIASNLLKHGHQLSVLEHPGNQPLTSLLAAGAKSFATSAEVAERSEFILLCVTGSPQVEAVLTGQSGVLQGLKANSVVIDCSTAIPNSTVEMAKRVQAAGGFFLDAPMTRTAKEAAEGRLNLLVGGDTELFARCEPVLRCFAEYIMHAGPVGSGHRMKLIHNYVSLGVAALVAEAAASAHASGIEPQTFYDILAKGGGAGIVLERLKPFLLQSDPNGLKFTISNAQKDLTYYNTMAQDCGATDTIAKAIKTTLDSAVAKGHAEAYVPELIRILGK